jgi:hypothetical protein
MLTFWKADPWLPIRPMIDMFNQARERCLEPGHVLVVDESMSAWRGRSLCFRGAADEDVRERFGLPHKTKIARKPQGVGLEIRNICCGETGILLRLELQEGKDKMRTLEHSAALGSGTSSTVRLCLPWQGTRRVVVGDSAFGSVKTARELHKRGLHFTGLVKTASREFPKGWLASYKYPSRGAHVVMKAKIQATNTTLYACGWHDRTTKMFVSTCGTTLAAKVPALKLRYKREGDAIVTFFKEVPRPSLAETYFDNANAIDVHNHYRQGSLALEETWRTQTWWHRSFATLLGMTVTDSFLLYNHFHPGQERMTFTEFVSQLCTALVRNREDLPPADNLRSRDNTREQPASLLAAPRAQFALLSSHALYNTPNRPTKRCQRRCTICHKKCAFYCTLCSCDDRLVSVCNPADPKHSCWATHAAIRAH